LLPQQNHSIFPTRSIERTISTYPDNERNLSKSGTYESKCLTIE
jgi:hypothetical protein